MWVYYNLLNRSLLVLIYTVSDFLVIVNSAIMKSLPNKCLYVLNFIYSLNGIAWLKNTYLKILIAISQLFSSQAKAGLAYVFTS